MDVLGGAPVNNLVLSGPRSATAATKASLIKVKAKGKGAAAQGSDGGADGGGSAATTTTERMRTAHVQVKGTSVFRGITIEGDIVVAAGHLIMVRCCLRGTVTTRPGATLTMIECDAVDHSFNRGGQIKVGKDSSAFVFGCKLGIADEEYIRTSIKATRGFKRLEVIGCSFDHAFQGVLLMEGASGFLKVQNCSFTNVGTAVTIVRAQPCCSIFEISIIRTRPGFQNSMLFVNADADFSVMLTAIKFFDRVPEAIYEATCTAIANFFQVMGGAKIIVDKGTIDWDICKEIAKADGSHVFRSLNDYLEAQIHAEYESYDESGYGSEGSYYDSGGVYASEEGYYFGSGYNSDLGMMDY